MDVDIAQLASQVEAFLIPYLVKGGEAFAGETGKRTAEALWEKFKPKVEAKESAKEALQDVKDSPDDKGALASFEYQIRKMLEKDPGFAEAISITIGNINASSMQAGDNSVLIGGSVGRNFVQGDRNIIAEQLQIIFEQKHITSPVEQQNAEKAYRLYLEKLRRFCNALPLAALGGEESSEEDITLDKIYVDLDTTQFKQTPEDKSPRTVKIEDREFSLGDERTPISVMEAATTNKRLVLLGEAGAGKSTFAKVLLALQASVLLGETKELAGFDAGLIPVLIVLRELSPRLAKLQLGNLSAEQQKHILANAILEKIREDIHTYKTATFIPVLDEAIESGKVLLAFDGLDEVPQDLRGRVRQAVGALIQIHQIERIIITCRSRSYIGTAVFPNFQSFTIAPFDDEKISQFARAWYNEQRHLGRIQADHAEKRADDLSNSATSSDLNEMSRNPMMLTSIAIIHQKDIGLPRERVRLYQLIVDVLVSRWQKYKTGEEGFAPSPALTDFLKDFRLLRATLERLAYETHRIGSKAEHKSEKSAETDLARSQALMLLESSEYLGSLALASEFLDYVDQRAGLLVGKGGDLEHPTSYSFPHRTIQEYLAGCYMVSRRERGREYYNHAAEGDFWSLAAVMGAEELFYNRLSTDALLDLAYYLCPANLPQTEQDDRSLLWSGQMANILGNETIQRDTGSPSGGSVYLQRLIPRTVDLLESHLTPRERAEAGDTLAKLGDPRPGVIPPLPRGEGTGVRDAFIFCEIPAGPFLMGNTKETDPASDDGEVPQITYSKIKSNYYISRYPITNAQFDLFVNDPEGYANERWYTDAGKDWRKKTKQGGPPKQGGAFDLPNHPVVNVTWYESLAFTRWLTNKLRNENTALKVWERDNLREVPIEFPKWEVRLPTEAEWEKAARGTRGLRYPWGNEITPNHANYSDTNINATSAVGAFLSGMNEYGLLDMSGNVWEWCATKWTDNYKDYAKKENNEPEGDAPRVVRGGAFFSYERNVRCAYRYGNYPYYRSLSIGFRVVVSPFF